MLFFLHQEQRRLPLYGLFHVTNPFRYLPTKGGKAENPLCINRLRFVPHNFMSSEIQSLLMDLKSFALYSNLT